MVEATLNLALGEPRMIVPLRILVSLRSFIVPKRVMEVSSRVKLPPIWSVALLEMEVPPPGEPNAPWMGAIRVPVSTMVGPE